MEFVSRTSRGPAVHQRPPWEVLGRFNAYNITKSVKAKDVDEDDAYLYFGIWSSIPDNITGMGITSGTLQAAEPRNRKCDLSNFDALIGPATFRGGAVGKYVTQGQVGGQNAKIGTFTATATLNADFGADAEAGTLSWHP